MSVLISRYCRITKQVLRKFHKAPFEIEPLPQFIDERNRLFDDLMAVHKVEFGKKSSRTNYGDTAGRKSR
uniref:Uncharacterized protein n=1 Tax=Globodera rostochiensis TaxID=31243 RepID=A0A914HGU7_GLORO